MLITQSFWYYIVIYEIVLRRTSNSLWNVFATRIARWNVGGLSNIYNLEIFMLMLTPNIYDSTFNHIVPMMW